MMKLDILDYTVYGNDADSESDSLLRTASEASGFGTRIVHLARGKALPHLEKRVWLRYDLRSRDDLAWVVGMAKDLEASGRLVFPSARSILLTEDKWESHLALARAGVASVETYELRVPPPKGKQVVLKPRVGWGGMGMKLVTYSDEAFTLPDAARDQYVWQPYIPHRRTLTVALAGESPAAVLEKKASSHDFRTNAGFGEEGIAVPDPGGAVALAVRALMAMELAAGGVDIIEDEGRLKVLEVNSAPCLWYDTVPALDLAGPMFTRVMEWMEKR